MVEEIKAFVISDGRVFKTIEEANRYDTELNLLHLQENVDALRSWDGNSVDGDVLACWLAKHKEVVSIYLNNLEG